MLTFLQRTVLNRSTKLKPFKDSSEREKLIRVLYAIEGLTYYEDSLLNETKQDSFANQVYTLAHGVLSDINVGCHHNREEKCVHAGHLEEQLEKIEERLKFGNILDIDKIFSEFKIGDNHD